MKKLDAIKAIEGMQLPATLKAMAAMAVSFMDDATIERIFTAAQDAITKLQAGDRSGAEALLNQIGLPKEVTKDLLDKVSNASPHQDG